jgi:CobQ-like glutamine amidotransferase family enzyme
MERADKQPVEKPREGKLSVTSAVIQQPAITLQQEPLRLVHLYPDLLNLYGDGGNLKVLMARLAWRGIPAELVEVHYGEELDLEHADLVFLGGGPDREQHLASEELLKNKEARTAYVENNGVLLAICGGFQILGKNWLMGDESVEGLSIIDAETLRANKGFDRLIDNIALVSPLASHPVIGYENHAGRTHLGEGLEPFGKVISSVGHGNNDTSGADGVLYKNIIGTYLHGPLLGKNPEVADWLLARALERKFGQAIVLEGLDSSVELNANAFMASRLIK